MPGAAAPTPEDLTRLSGRIFHLHVKDAVCRIGPVPAGELIAVGTPVGMGDVDWRAHFRALQGMNYGGLLYLETHWHAEPEGLAVVCRLSSAAGDPQESGRGLSVFECPSPPLRNATSGEGLCSNARQSLTRPGRAHVM